MNMPVDDNGTVHFTTTLFALIRESLGIKMGPAEVMDQRDNELRLSLLKFWPVQAKRMMNLLVPPDSGTPATANHNCNKQKLRSN